MANRPGESDIPRSRCSIQENRLIGYSITNESDHLNLEERMNALERRMPELGH